MKRLTKGQLEEFTELKNIQTANSVALRDLMNQTNNMNDCLGSDKIRGVSVDLSCLYIRANDDLQQRYKKTLNSVKPS